MNRKIVVMGVSGCGKSLIASQIAEHYQIPFHDGDDYHPPENIKKMSSGTPLTDEDRASWLLTLNKLIQKSESIVLACSSLKPEYRTQLAQGTNGLTFVYLKGSIDLIWSRMTVREGHYFEGKTLLESQFETLIEPTPEEAIIIDIAQPAESVVKDAIRMLSRLGTF
jgi:gluconokinase